MSTCGIDIHPLIRYLDHKGLSKRYSRRERQTVLYDYVQFFCEYYSNDTTSNKESEIERTIEKHKLARTDGDYWIWNDMLDKVHDIIRQHLYRAGWQLPVQSMLVVDFDRGFAFFNELQDSVGNVDPNELMNVFKKWLEKQEEDGENVPRKTFELVDRFVSEAGWLR